MTDNRELSPGAKPDLQTVLVQVITGSRVLTAVVFASTAITPRYARIAIAAYAYSSLADLLDGFVARRLRRQSEGGAAFDIGGDKYLLIVSALYGVAVGANVTACCILIVRSVFVPALRSVRVDGMPLIPPRRGLGAIETIPIRTATAYLLLCAPLGAQIEWGVANAVYWIAAVTSCLTVIYSISDDWPRIKRAFAPTTGSPTSR